MVTITVRPALLVGTLLSLLLVFSLTLSGTVYAAEPIVKAIVFQGNQQLDDVELMQYITATKLGEPLDEEAVEADRKALFDSGYFWSVQPAEVSFVPGGVHLIFKVVENPVVERVTIETTALPVEEFLGALYTQPGKVLNVNGLRDDLNQVIPEKAMTDYGIPVRVSDASVSPETGEVNIVLEAQIVSEIKISGNEKTNDHVITRELGIKPGDVLNLNTINQGLHRVLMLGYFDEISREILPGEKDDEVILHIRVAERKTAVFTGGVGYSSHEGLIGYVDVADENFRGNGQRVNFRWEFGKNRTSYDIGFYEPYLGEDGRNSIGANIYRTTREYKHQNPEIGIYEAKSTGASVTLGRRLTPNTRGYLVPKMEKVSDWEGEYTTRSLRLTTVTDTSNHPFFPTTGNKLRLSAEFAGGLLGGDSQFSDYQADYSKYFSLGRRNQTLAFRLSGGVLTGDNIPDPERYRVGGSESLRGYKYGEFEGDRKLVLNSEYRFQIKDAFHGVLFADIGNAWDSGESISMKDLNVGYGAGLRIDTPLGVLRFDYGFGDDGGNFYFSIGQMF